MTEAQLQKIEKRCEAATPGPWTYEKADGYCNASPNYTCPHDDDTCGEWCDTCPVWIWDTGAYIPETLTLDIGEYDGINNKDADFIAHAREDLPDLLAYATRRCECGHDAAKVQIMERLDAVWCPWCGGRLEGGEKV